MTRTLIACALAAALLTSGALAYVDEYSMELTPVDRLALSMAQQRGQAILPPAEYDHQYQGKLRIVGGYSEEQMAQSARSSPALL